MTVVCLGEAIVDLVCEQPVRDISEARSFVPHCGGAVANAAVAAARSGASVALAGGVGNDAWGGWLEDRLRQEGVDLRWFTRIDHLATPVAFVTVDDRGEPSFSVYGHGIEAGVESLAGRVGELVDSASAVVIGSNTLAGETERKISLEAQRLAFERDTAFVFDPNLRLHRWPDRALVRGLARELCAGALLVKVNREEAIFMTGEDEPADAANAICALGATVAVVTLGSEGAIARGAVAADAPGVGAEVVDATGAGDVVTGVLVAALAAANFDPAAIAETLSAAVETASRSTESWGAAEALPPADQSDGR
jgi:fructokinase